MHFLEEVEIFFYRAVSVRAVFSGFGKGASIFSYLFRGQVADIGVCLFYQLQSVFVHLLEVVGCVVKSVMEVETEPADIFNYGVYVFLLFFDWVCVVKAQVACAALIFKCDSEIQTDAFSVTDVQVPVRFGREPGGDAALPFVCL